MMDLEAELRKFCPLPTEQEIAHVRAYLDAAAGLEDGELQPLADYIRAGWPIDAGLAKQIADAIEGPDGEGFTLKMINRRGHKPLSRRRALKQRQAEIAIFVIARQFEVRRADQASQYESIIAEAKAKFGAKRSTIAKAVAEHRDKFEVHDLGEFLDAIEGAMKSTQ